MLPADQGDALWVEYGSPGDLHHLLIDGGTRRTFNTVKSQIEETAAVGCKLDLLVITHVDSDHIGGIPKLLDDAELDLQVADVWFNAWRHLPDVGDVLGPVEGEIVSAELDKLGWPWNAAFDEKAVVAPSDGKLPVHELPGGMRLTLLSPTPQALSKLRPAWEATVRAAGLEPGVPGAALDRAAHQRGIRDLLGDGSPNVPVLARSKFTPDNAPANGSTIAFLAEYGDSSCIFAGDAHPDILQAGLQRACQERKTEKLAVTAFKLPHHGSKYNVSLDCLELVSTDKYLVSTNGNQTGHPDPEGIARAIVQGGNPTVYFNYRVDTNKMWDSRALEGQYHYQAVYADPPGLTVEL
jgi:hypothetical protein